MAKLLRRFRRKALQVPPEPSGRSGHLPKGQSHLSVPAGGEAAPIQARRRKFPAFWRTKPAPSAGADLGEAPTKPRWSWLRMRFCGQDPAQEGRRAGRLWGLLCGQQRPQEPSPHSQQGASPCPGSEDLSAPSDQELEDPSTSTISSARDSSSAWGSSSSDASGRCCFVPGTPTESAAEEWLEMTTEEAAPHNPPLRPEPWSWCGWGGRSLANRFSLAIPHSRWVQDEGQQLRFLRAIYPACLAAQDRGQDTLEPHCCKAAVVERIVELIEELPKDSPPSEILASCLAAVGNLSTMKPALEPELESRLLQAALGSVFTLGTETDATDIQALHKVMPELLDAVLGNLLLPDSRRRPTGSTGL
ncbi:uncharacterized protein LOC120374524 [Mauremys reevesii]|uniref:uncharacterized protein LOC120374524 n=1 Tax=Mauremys reevesii TaxID=260615 RepID=UPI00193F6F30|nr:uncharacterized protein LOC120374524 [Mauremys reevesii]